MPERDAVKVKLSDATAPLYAVLDGAKFEDLPSLLFDNDFSHKPLYHNTGSELREVEMTVPHLVRFDTWKYWENDLSSAQRLDALLGLMEDLSAAVFWEYEGEVKYLFRHLRTINYVMIPRDADTPPMPDPLDPEGDTFGNTNTHQQVLFRHADANVMAQVLPVLSSKQLSRFMGPARAVIFAPNAEWRLEETVIRVDNPKDTYNTTHPLKLSQSEMDMIERRRIEVRRWRTVAFLKQDFDDTDPKIDEQFLYQITVNSEASANEIGIESEINMWLWAWLSLISDEASLNHRGLRQLIKDTATFPDVALELICDDIDYMDTFNLEGFVHGK